MTLQLYRKECKKILKSAMFCLFLICIILFYISQSKEMSFQGKPKLNQEFYGINNSDDPNIIMEITIQRLKREQEANKYSAYPIGFYKTVALNKKEQKRMGEILKEVTCATTTYDSFLQLMKEADDLIGGSSLYSEHQIESSGYVETTYEDAMNEYQELIKNDKLSGAYARIFCDYMGYILAILSVFVPVGVFLKDKRAKMQELIYSRKTFSIKIIATRYLATVSMVMVPIILIGFVLTIKFIFYSMKEDITVDILAYAKYICGWILPTVLVVSSVGMLLTILTDTPIAILVQGIWWFADTNKGLSVMGGGYNNLLSPRHNTTGNYEVFQENFDILVLNRVGYTALALLLFLLTIVIYENKRKGRLNHYGAIFSNRKSKSED